MRVKGGGWAGGGGREDFNYPPEGLGRSTLRYSSSKVGVYKVKKSVVLQVWPKLYLCGVSLVSQVSPNKKKKNVLYALAEAGSRLGLESAVVIIVQSGVNIDE